MIPTELLTASSDDRAPAARFRFRDVRRVAAYVWPHRRILAAGMALTLLFAFLHAAGIGAAFPVFKVLLEKESVPSWAERAAAGRRLGAVFSREDGGSGAVRVGRVDADGALASQEVQSGDLLRTEAGDSDVLRALARHGDGLDLRLRVFRGDLVRIVDVSIPPQDLVNRALLAAADLIPSVSGDQKLKTLGGVLLVLLAASLIANACRYFGEVLIARAVLAGLMDLRSTLYHKTLRLPMSFFVGQSTSDIVTRFVQDIQEVQRGLLTLFGKFVREPIRILFLLGLAFLVDWRVTVIMVFVAPAAVVVFWAVGRKVKKANTRLLQAYGVMIGAVSSTLQNLRMVKAYTAEQVEEARLDKIDAIMMRNQLKLARLDAFVGPMLETIGVAAASALAMWMLSQVLAERLSLSKFALLGVTFSVMFDPIRKMSDVWVRIQRSAAAAERIFDVIDRPMEGRLDKASLPVAPLADQLELRNVTFRYPGSSADALNNVNLTIRRGDSVALVGANGSGKTTVVNLLLRLFDADSGMVAFDGVDVRELNLTQLRKQFGMVPQDAVVFAGSPLDNIAYGAGEVGAADADRAERAAAKAHAEEFIRILPGGFRGKVGERGETLSGGQRQRLAIARAVYREAPILIFDEATSQIDSESEAKIQDAIRTFAKDKTTIIIAHRLSTILFADRIVVMEAGRVVAQGTHAELYEQCSPYRALCDTQWVEQPAA